MYVSRNNAFVSATGVVSVAGMFDYWGVSTGYCFVARRFLNKVKCMTTNRTWWYHASFVPGRVNVKVITQIDYSQNLCVERTLWQIEPSIHSGRPLYMKTLYMKRSNAIYILISRRAVQLDSCPLLRATRGPAAVHPLHTRKLFESPFITAWIRSWLLSGQRKGFRSLNTASLS